MATVERFEELDVWQRSRRLANLVYDLSDHGAFARDYGLRDQMRRAAVSIMSNIAEGFESRTQTMFIEYLGRARGSAGELRAQAYLALDRGYVTATQAETLLAEAERCSRQIVRLQQHLETRPGSRQVREDSISYDV